MKREELEEYIMETYDAEADFPWRSAPNFEVFRHRKNRKWFALVMDIPAEKLGLEGEDLTDVVNLKGDPVLISSLHAEPGFFPAYHMNKEHWVTAALNGSAADETIRMLIDMSYEMTK